MGERPKLSAASEAMVILCGPCPASSSSRAQVVSANSTAW